MHYIVTASSGNIYFRFRIRIFSINIKTFLYAIKFFLKIINIRRRTNFLKFQKAASNFVKNENLLASFSNYLLLKDIILIEWFGLWIPELEFLKSLWG
jgi:hypothetical protein